MAHAILTINQIPGSSYKANITFDWRSFQLRDKRFKPAEQWVQERNHPLPKGDLETIRRTLRKGVPDKNTLDGIGFRIWDLFPTNVQECIRKFDVYADSAFGVLAFIIFTDVLDIPFELCITKRKGIARSRMKSWSEKYDVGIEILGVSNPAETGIANRRNKLAVILTPFPDLRDKKFLQDCGEGAFSNEYDRLEKTIEEIRQRENIEIEILGCPENIDELHRIEDVLIRGKHNLVLYLGSFHNEDEMTVYDPSTQTPKYISIKSIETEHGSERAIFLDACRTGIVGTQGRQGSAGMIPKHLLEKGLCAYVGTVQEIQPTVGAVFARYFLKSLCLGASSLCRSMHDARTESASYFRDSLPNERYRVQSSAFCLYGRNDEILLNSFTHVRPELTLIYPSLVDLYFKGFRGYIYPSSMPEVVLEKKDTLEDVYSAVESAQNPFLADLPILQAARLISKFRGKKDRELVIVGGLFRLRPEVDDSALYFAGKLSDYDFFYCESPLSLVTAMALTHFRFREREVYDVFKCESGYRRTSYADIHQNALNCLPRSTKMEPFLLATEHKASFENELRERHVESAFTRVGLYLPFKETLNEQRYALTSNLPAEVLVTRKIDYEADSKLYREFFERWASWQEQSKKTFPASHELIFQLTQSDVDTIMTLMRFVSERLQDSFLGKFDQLEQKDFRLPSSPDKRTIEEWRSDCQALVKECKGLLLDARRASNLEMEEARALDGRKKREEADKHGQRAREMDRRISDLETRLNDASRRISSELSAPQRDTVGASLEKMREEARELAGKRKQ